MRQRFPLRSFTPLIVLLGLLVAACAPQAVVVPEEAPPAPAPAAIPGLDAELLAQPLGLDPAVRTGTLPNGLTYYVRRNTEPRDRAELRLVVDAGSVLEDEDQRGLAHLLEHMAFNGTERFPELELVNYLERIGMRFGPDLNAYTSFDETVYMLQVPTDDAELLDTGFTVLREWAGNITLLDEDIEAERGVVLEEWRVRLGAQSRIQDQQFPVLFEGSRYAERLPIGLPEVIRHAPTDRVRDFYRDWYRPELMAVVAVGDFDPAEIEAVIRERFADLENPRGAPARVAFDVPAQQETRIVVATDPEQTMTVVQLLRKLPHVERETVGDFREALVDRLYAQMLNARLREITRRPHAPFHNAGTFIGGYARPISPFTMMAVTDDDGVPRAMEALLEEAERVREHGFTATELERARANVLRGYERAYEERDQRPSRAFAGGFVNLFTRGGALPAIERERALAQQLLPTIALQEVDRRAEVIAGEDGRVLLVAMPEKEGVVPPSEEELRGVLRAVGEKELTPYVDAAVGDALLAEVPAPLPIVSESRYEDDGIVEWRLANGVTVVVKQTDFRNDEILLTAFRPGGSSVVPDERFRAAQQAGAAVSQGGVGDFSATDLERFLAGRTVRIGPYVGSVREGLSGSFSPADLETSLQLIHLYFTEPRRDEEAFEAHKQRVLAMLQNRAASPMTAFGDTLGVVLSQGHPRARPVTSEEIAQVELDEALAVYRERFGDANDFVFVFVGAVDPDSLAPLARRYLATLPADTSSAHEARDLGIRPPEGIVERIVYRGMEPQARVALVFSGELMHAPGIYDPVEQDSQYLAQKEASRWERFRLGRLAEALGIRLREELREDRGGVYGVGVNVNPDRMTGTYTFSVQFGTDPDRVEELVQVVFDEIDAFRTQGPEEDILGRVIERHRRSEETDLRSNQHWSRVLLSSYLHGDAPQEYLYGEELRRRITIDDLRQTARDYLDPQRHVRVVLLPEAAQ